MRAKKTCHAGEPGTLGGPKAYYWPWGAKITFPYPVPFDLLGDRAIGWLDTIGYDADSGFRAALGNKGTQFIFKRKDGAIPDDVITGSLLYSSKIEHESNEEEKK